MRFDRPVLSRRRHSTDVASRYDVLSRDALDHGGGDAGCDRGGSGAEGLRGRSQPLADLASEWGLAAVESRPRRLLNVLVALVALALTLPLCIIIAIAIKLTSRGPVLYLQERVGLDRRSTRPLPHDERRLRDLGGRPFLMYKFRTMRVDAEALSGAVWAAEEDPRVSPIGRFLRHYRLDELPQFLNVLEGDMNVVGPRPERAVIFAELRARIPNYTIRQRSRPGITGYAQVNLEYDSSIGDVVEKLKYDLEYVSLQSVATDLRIMAKTVPVMLFREKLLRRPSQARPSTAPLRANQAAIVHVTSVPVQLRVFLTGQASFIVGQGFSLHAISSHGPELDRFARQEGVPVHAVDITQQVSPLRDVVALLKLWWTVRIIRPHVVHAHSPKGGLLGMIAAVLAGVPVRVYHIRGLPHTAASGFRRLVLMVSERVSCALAHRVLAVSRSMRDIAVGEGLCAAHKIKVLLRGSGNGVDASRRFRPQGEAVRAAVRAELGIPSDARVVGFVGRVVRDKGVVELAAAWERLRDEIPNVHLVVVGWVEPKDPVPGEVLAALESDPRVHMTGEVLSADRIYAAMDVVVLPSHREGMPNVALEAAAMELPIVATDVPGCVDAVQDGFTGTLVPVGDIGALRDALRRYVEDPQLRSSHGAAARRRVLEDFRQEAIWSAIALEYRTLLEERAVRRAGTVRAFPRSRRTRSSRVMEGGARS